MQFEFLPLEIRLLEISKYLDAKDLRSYGLICKAYLPILNSSRLWSKLAEKDFGHSIQEFEQKLKQEFKLTRQSSVNHNIVRILKESGSYIRPFKLYKEIEEDSKWPKTCQYVMIKGAHKGEYCGKKTEYRSNWCRLCSMKKGIARYQTGTHESRLANAISEGLARKNDTQKEFYSLAQEILGIGQQGVQFPPM